MPKVPDSPDVFKVTSGTQIMLLIARLKEYTEEWDHWHKENPYKSPEQARTTPMAYKVALAQHLIFFGEVSFRELALNLAKKTNGLNPKSYDMALMAIEDVLRE